MLSKAQSKYIRSLAQQKYRNEYNVLVAEGAKIAGEWLRSGWKIQYIIGEEAWVTSHLAAIAKHPEAETHIVVTAELEALSIQQTPNQAILIIYKPAPPPVQVINEWCIALDTLQDPGNMGTIIRIADWFGIRHIACSPGCVDIYNPKVIQSAMGGHLRVNIFEASLESYLSAATIPVIAATLGGESIYTIKKPPAGILVIGNESKGISDSVKKTANCEVMIPRKGGAESLNAGVSAGILCALLIGS